MVQHLNYMNSDTRTFSEIFPSDTEFQAFWETLPTSLQNRLLSGYEYPDAEEGKKGVNYDNYGLQAIYFLLISNYANDPIASYDENRFKLQCMSIIYEAGPAWQKAMAVQEKLLNMNSDDVHSGSKQHAEHTVDWVKQNQTLGNVAQHPDTNANDISDTNSFGDDKIGTRSEKVLPYISEQRTGYDKGHTNDTGSNDTTWTKDNVKGWVELLYSLDDTLCSRFIYRFKKLFKKVAYNTQPPLMFRED